MELNGQNTALVLDSTADFPEAPQRFPNVRVVPLYVRFGADSFRDYVELGQPVVHEHNVGPVLAARGHGLRPVADRRDDLDVGAHSQQQLERLPEDLVVLDQEDPDRRRHRRTLLR